MLRLEAIIYIEPETYTKEGAYPPSLTKLRRIYTPLLASNPQHPPNTKKNCAIRASIFQFRDTRKTIPHENSPGQ